LAYEQKLKREGEEIRQAKRYMGVIDAHLDYFRKVWGLQDQRREERRDRDRDWGGWSR
jgi:hypothetical protein